MYISSTERASNRETRRCMALPIAEAVFINGEEAKAAVQGHGKTDGFAVFVTAGALRLQERLQVV